MMGAGKTAVGTSLARVLAVPFLDSDAEIVKAANMSIPEIFERDGEAFFRRKESQVIARLLDQKRKGVLSTGGGAYMREENRAAIAGRGVAVWLRAPVDLLWQRVRHKDSRPLLHTANPYQTLVQLTAEREPSYAHAEIVVDSCPGYSVDDMTGVVVQALLERPEVLVKR